VVNEESHNVSVLVGNRDGTFRPAVNLDAGPGPWSVAVADLNRDGVPDLVVANQSSATVSVLQGNGDGTFQAALTFAVGQTPRFVVAGDFNGDGVPDLAVTNYQDSTVTVLINNTPPPDTIWSKPVNATATRDSLRKVTGCDGCFDAGASSKPQIDSGDGYAEFTAGEKTFLRVAGLTHAFTGLDPDTIDFGIRLQSGFAEIRENGAYRADTTFEADDVFRITVQSGVVSYSKNGVVFYTSTAAPTYPLVFGAALASLNATVSSLVVSAF